MISEYERLLGATSDALRRAEELGRAARAYDLFEQAQRTTLNPDFATSTLEQDLTREVRRALATHDTQVLHHDRPYDATAMMLRQMTAARQAYEMVVMSHGLPSDTAILRRSAGQDLWERALRTAQAQDLQRSAATAAGLTSWSATHAGGVQDHLFHAPQRDELRSLLDRTLAAQRVTASVLGEDLVSMAVRGTFEALQTPWLHNQHALTSAQAMADLQMLGVAARGTPFAATAVETLRSHLGDWRDPLAVEPAWVETPRRLELYVDRGFDRALADFPAAAFNQGLSLAGLPAHDTDDDEADDRLDAELSPDHLRAHEAYQLLQRFELAVRRFIASAMEAAHGADWVRTHLPPKVRESWEHKRTVAERDGAPARPLHHYADFTDYKQIIEMGENWQTVFRSVFRRSEDVRESFQRLFPVRIATMHAHGITQDDVLLLRFETGRILRAIQRAGLG